MATAIDSGSNAGNADIPRIDAGLSKTLAIDELFAEIGEKAGCGPSSVTELATPTRTSLGYRRAPQPGVAIHRARRHVQSLGHLSDDKPTWIDRAMQFVVLGCLAFAVVLVFQGLSAPARHKLVGGTSPQPIGASGEAGFKSIPIGDVELGYRMLGENPAHEQAELVEPNPATWRKIGLHMRKQSGRSLFIDLLRPMYMIEVNEVELGKTVYLSLPEMGAEGEAEVISIGPCPPITPGPGGVVTGKFMHQADNNSNLVQLKLEGEANPDRVTASHPYWSEDRQEFIPVGKLQPGERVNTQFGMSRVVSVTPQPEFRGHLINLETTEHVFRVGPLGTLVHNSCATQAYGGPGGGHHVFSKKAFEGVTAYDQDLALAIPQSEIARLALNHDRVNGITQTQRKLFKELAESGRPNTLAEHARIARESLIVGGLSEKDAASVVRKALNQLKSWGIKAPSGIPWN